MDQSRDAQPRCRGSSSLCALGAGGGGPEENQQCLSRPDEAIIGYSDKIESASPNIVEMLNL